MRMAISTRRLAQLAEVSPSTASRVMRGHGDVGEETRRKVLALARRHHIPLPAMPAQKTPNLLNALCSMINTDNDEPPSDQGFNHRLLAGLTRGATACGAELLNIGQSHSWMREWPLVVNRKQVDGVALPLGDEFMVHPPFPAPVPTLFIFSGPPQADVVTVANFDGGRLLGEHLAELGHRRVAYIGSRSSMSLERLAGLRTALELRKGTVPPELTSIPPRVGGREDVTLRLDARGMTQKAGDPGPDGFTALMCYNDYMAAAAIMHLRQYGVRVPEDVSVVGFDNVRPGWYAPSTDDLSVFEEQPAILPDQFVLWGGLPVSPALRQVIEVLFA